MRQGFVALRLMCSSGATMPPRWTTLWSLETLSSEQVQSRIGRARAAEEEPSIKLGGTYTKKQIAKLSRGRDQPLMPLYVGKEIKKDGSASRMWGEKTYRLSPTSWHYGWRSSKHTKSAQHVFAVYILRGKRSGKMECIATCESGQFTVASSKRAREPPTTTTAATGISAAKREKDAERGAREWCR